MSSIRFAAQERPRVLLFDQPPIIVSPSQGTLARVEVPRDLLADLRGGLRREVAGEAIFDPGSHARAHPEGDSLSFGGESQPGSWRVKRSFPQVLTRNGFKRSVSVASLERQLLLFENWIAYVGPCRFSIEICSIVLLR